MASAPASSNPFNRSTVPATEGSPAVMYGTKARRPASLSAVKRSSIVVRVAVCLGDAAAELEEVVANADAISFRAFSLDDRATVVVVLRLVGEIGQISRVQHIAARVADDADDRARKHFRNRVHGVDDPQLECIEDDERSNRINAGEVDERLHDD